MKHDQTIKRIRERNREDDAEALAMAVSGDAIAIAKSLHTLRNELAQTTDALRTIAYEIQARD